MNDTVTANFIPIEIDNKLHYKLVITDTMGIPISEYPQLKFTQENIKKAVNFLKPWNWAKIAELSVH